MKKQKGEVINYLRVQRAIHELTQSDLALGAGCTTQAICAIETGKFNPSTKLALLIVRYLNELKKDAGMNPVQFEDIFKLKD